MYAESLDARREHSDSYWDSAVTRDTWPAVSSEMIFAADRDLLVYHTSAVVSPLCVDHMVLAPRSAYREAYEVEVLRGPHLRLVLLSRVS